MEKNDKSGRNEGMLGSRSCKDDQLKF